MTGKIKYVLEEEANRRIREHVRQFLSETPEQRRRSNAEFFAEIEQKTGKPAHSALKENMRNRKFTIEYDNIAERLSRAKPALKAVMLKLHTLMKPLDDWPASALSKLALNGKRNIIAPDKPAEHHSMTDEQIAAAAARLRRKRGK